jgi:putative peptide zinc metalloprotease protein
MRFGPTSLQVSSVLAKGLRRPKLRSDIRVSEQTVAGETSYVVKIHETNSYNRFGASEYELLTLCDGTRTPAEIAQLMTERHPDEPLDETEVLEYLDGVEPAMWERSVGEKNLAVLERIRDERKSRLDQSSALYISFKAWDPNNTLAKLDRWLGWMYTKGFVVFSLILFIFVAYILAADWTRVQQDTAALYSFAGKSAYDIWAFWILLMVLGSIHEMGHGLTCKHYGGDVHQMGFLLIYFTPAFYTDTTDIMLFQRGPSRQWVIFAGIWIELVICGLAALLWHFTAPGLLINDLAYKTMLLSGIQGALINLNPLIKADGYYALSQFLEVDNLREDSFAYLRVWVRKYLLREDIDLPLATRRQRRIYFIFGWSAILYSSFLIILMLLFVKNILVTKLGEWGYLATAAVVYYFARKGIRKSLPAVRAWLRQKKEEYMAWKMTRAQQAGAIGLALLLFIPPFPSRVSTEFILEPGRESDVRAQVPGKVAGVFVRQGDFVKEGQILAELDNPELSANRAVLMQEYALAGGNLRTDILKGDFEAAAQAVQERKRLQEELTMASNQTSDLQIRAPFDGTVTTPLSEQKVGESVAAGDSICQLADRRTMKARVLVRDLELQDVSTGAKARLKVLPYPFRTYTGQVVQILPAAALDRPVAHQEQLERLGQTLTNYFGVTVDFPNPDGTLIEGMTGTAKISGPSYPLAWQFGRAAWRWLKSQVW